MQPHLSKLTSEEQARNKHGHMHLYSYTDENGCVYKATTYFPEIISHVNVSVISREDIFVPKEQLVRGLSPGFDLNMYYPGFPILRHIRYIASLEKAKVYPIRSLYAPCTYVVNDVMKTFLQVKVFQQASLGDNMILHITAAEETLNLETLASQLLGKSVYVEWPHLKEALVVGVANCEVKFTLKDPLAGYNHNNVNTEDVKGLKATEFNLQMKHIKET